MQSQMDREQIDARAKAILDKLVPEQEPVGPCSMSVTLLRFPKERRKTTEIAKFNFRATHSEALGLITILNLGSFGPSLALDVSQVKTLEEMTGKELDEELAFRREQFHAAEAVLERRIMSGAT
jgi:hypothetical protein